MTSVWRWIWTGYCTGSQSFSSGLTSGREPPLQTLKQGCKMCKQSQLLEWVFLLLFTFQSFFKFVYLKIIINEHDCTVYRIQGVHTRWKCSDNYGSLCVVLFSINGYKKKKKKIFPSISKCCPEFSPTLKTIGLLYSILNLKCYLINYLWSLLFFTFFYFYLLVW